MTTRLSATFDASDTEMPQTEKNLETEVTLKCSGQGQPGGPLCRSAADKNERVAADLPAFTDGGGGSRENSQG